MQYGCVFGAYYLAAFLFSPLTSKCGGCLGPKTLCILGAIFQAVSAILFGFLKYTDDKIIFIGMSYFLRFLSGIAEAAAWTASITILMTAFPTRMTTMMAWTEMSFGVGSCFGPSLGAFLYEIGGFCFPFWTVGTLAFVQSLLLIIVVPTIEPSTKEPTKDNSNLLTVKKAILTPSIFVPFMDLFVSYLGYGMITSMLEEYLDNEISVTEQQIGLTFTCLGLVYMVSSLSCGVLCDKLQRPGLLSILSNAVLAIAFTFLGPVIFMPIEPTFLSTTISASLMGMGFGIAVVTSFRRAQKAVISLGFKEDWNTYMTICSAWSTVFYLSNVIGPSLAGGLVESFGFRVASTAFPFMYVLNGFINLIELLKHSRNEHYETLE